MANWGWGGVEGVLSKYDFPDTSGSTFRCLQYSYLQLDFKMTNRLFSLTAPPGTFWQNSRQNLRLSSIRHIRYEASWLILYELCFFLFMRDFFLTFFVAKLKLWTATSKAMCLEFRVFWDEPHHIRLSTMIKSNVCMPINFSKVLC